MFSCFMFFSIWVVSNLMRNGVWWVLYVWEFKVFKVFWIIIWIFFLGKWIFGFNWYVFLKVFFNFLFVGFVLIVGFLKLEKKDVVDICFDSLVIFCERLFFWEILWMFCLFFMEGFCWCLIFFIEFLNKIVLDLVFFDRVWLEWFCFLLEELFLFIFIKFVCFVKFD